MTRRIPRVITSSQGGLPKCFGMPKWYDPSDDECIQCSVRHRCGIKVRRAKNSSAPAVQKKTSSSDTLRSEVGDSAEDEIVNPIKKENTKGWFGAFRHNLGVRSVAMALGEAKHGVEQIALEPYPGENTED